MTKEKEQIKDTVKKSIQKVQSPAEAERVLDELEQLSDGVTESQAARGAEASPAEPAQAVEQARQDAPPGQEASVTLAAVAAESVAPGKKAAEALEATQELLQAEARGQRPAADIVKPRGYLQDAVLRRMSPLQAWDAWLFIAVNHLPHTRLTNSAMYALTVAMTGGVGWSLGTLVVWLVGSRRAREALNVLVPSVTVATWIVEYPVKAYFRRRRPFIEVVRALVIGKQPGSWSFPSGHTASSFASARVLSTVWPEHRAGYYALAGLVGFSRTYLGAHYPGDVLAGALAGTALAEVTRRATRAILQRRGRRLLRGS